MSPLTQQPDAWQTAVENRLTSTDQRLLRLGQKIDKCFYIGIAAIAAIGIEIFWLFNNLNDKVTDLRLALGARTP